MIVKSSKNTIEFEQNPMSFRLTSKTRKQMTAIEQELQISKSDVIRICISNYYNKLKKEGVFDE
jgi:hypothetical protein